MESSRKLREQPHSRLAVLDRGEFDLRDPAGACKLRLAEPALHSKSANLLAERLAYRCTVLFGDNDHRLFSVSDEGEDLVGAVSTAAVARMRDSAVVGEECRWFVTPDAAVNDRWESQRACK